MPASRRTCSADIRRSFPVPVARSALLLCAGLATLFNTPAIPETARLISDDYEIPESLTGMPGNPVRGERILRDADNATCLICHALPIEEESDPGNIGPPLHGVGSRYTAGELRLRLVDPKRLNPDTVMPSYFRSEGLQEVAADHQGQTIYSAREIEDVIAYLLTLVAE